MLDAVPDPQDAPPLKWGIVAPGGIANKFADAVRDFTAGTVVAVGSRDAGRAADFAEGHGIPRSYGSYADLVADDEVEAVYVASPHSGHQEHALLAINAGKHVLIEKALARNSSEVEDIFAAAQQHRVLAMEAMWTRHLPHMAEVRRRVADGAIGEIVTLAADHGQALDLPNDHRLKSPELAGGALLDLGVYPIAFCVDLLGAPQDERRLGEVFTVADHNALARAVLQVLHHPNPLRAARAQQAARNYDWSSVGINVLAVYRAALSAAPTGRMRSGIG